MGAPIVSLTDIKTYLGKTGTDDDLLIASIASNASAMAERDTGRIFSVTSNVTTRYSTDGQTSLVIHDRPVNDATRTVTQLGAPLTENTNVWFLADRRNPDVTATVQLRAYNRDWFAHSFAWFDANLDSGRFQAGTGTPNDLVITGTVGHPVTPGDVKQATLELAGWLYWRAKGGASSLVDTLSGTDIDLSLLPMTYQVMVRNWKIHTFVAGVG
jgi:hypothetical protein